MNASPQMRIHPKKSIPLVNENPSRYPILRYYRATWASSSLPISSLLSLVSSISFRGRSRVSTNPSPPLFRPGWIYSASNDVYDVYPSAGAALETVHGAPGWKESRHRLSIGILFDKFSPLSSYVFIADFRSLQRVKPYRRRRIRFFHFVVKAVW